MCDSNLTYLIMKQEHAASVTVCHVREVTKQVFEKCSDYLAVKLQHHYVPTNVTWFRTDAAVCSVLYFELTMEVVYFKERQVYD